MYNASDAELETRRTTSKVARDQRKADGLCGQCGKRPPDPEYESCSECRARQRRFAAKRKERGVCLYCQEPAVTGQTMCLKCKVHHFAAAKAGRQRLKDLVFNAYGGYRCNCPGCTETNPDFLSIDHVNNDGAAHRKLLKTTSALYGWLKKNNYPTGFQPLCFNCNHSKGKRGGPGICAHLRVDHAADLDTSIATAASSG